MTDQERSCLVEKISAYIEIDPDTEALLASLEENERKYDRHQEVFSEGNALSELFVVKKGWFYSYTDMPDGRRQIVNVLHPGDIIGFPDVAFSYATSNARAAEEGVLCPFPKRKLDSVFSKSPKLTAAIFSIANCDHLCVIDSLRATGRMDARERIAFFLLDNVARLRITTPSLKNVLRMPMNQSEIGDALGLTHTYVSKTIREMETDGLISRSNGEITLEQEARLCELTGFVNRYAALDTSWFPK